MKSYIVTGFLAFALLAGIATACGGSSSQAPAGGIEIDIDHYHAPKYSTPKPRIVRPIYKTPAKPSRYRKV